VTLSERRRGNDLGTTLKYPRNAARIGLDTNMKYLRRTTSGAPSNGLGTTIKDLVNLNAGGAQLGRCAAGRLYLYSGKLALAVIYLLRIIVAGRCLAAGAPPLANALTAPAAGHSAHFNPQHWLLCHMSLY
jgi:hypothetical protein